MLRSWRRSGSDRAMDEDRDVEAGGDGGAGAGGEAVPNVEGRADPEVGADGARGDAERPDPSLFVAVVGQPRAVAQLRASARRPVHAYLFHGPPGSGKRAAATAFAAALLCGSGGCGVCRDCRRALAGIHSDLVVMERTGAALDVDGARQIVARAQMRPMEADRQVIVVTDLHLAVRSVPALLKTVEEPPPTTVFLLLAEDIPEHLVTVASRCVGVRFDPVPEAVITAQLVAEGVEPALAAVVARSAGGRLDRARLSATDPEVVSRLERWRHVPDRLDGTGAAAVTEVEALLGQAEDALGPLRTQHADELAALTEAATMSGRKGLPGRKDIEERHHREERRWRTDELRSGLAVLAAEYRDRLVDATVAGANRDASRAAAAVAAIEDAAAALARNPNELLLFESLFVTLAGMGE